MYQVIKIHFNEKTLETECQTRQDAISYIDKIERQTRQLNENYPPTYKIIKQQGTK